MWDVEYVNTTCLTHHELWFQDAVTKQYVSKIGEVPVGTQQFSIPTNTSKPVTNNYWSIAITSNFIARYFDPHIVR